MATDVSDCLIVEFLHQQFEGVVEFDHFTVFHDKNSIGIDDGCKSMSYNNDCAVLESLSEHFLDEIVCLEINICCSFVEYEYLCLSDDSSR